MNELLRSLPVFLSGVALSATLLVVGPGDARSQERDVDMAKMMELMGKYNNPGPSHAVLGRFVGEFTTELSMMGGPPEKGRAHGEWTLGRRFVTLEGEGTLMGMPSETFSMLGYDNFKQSFVTTYASSIETAMRHAEGDLTPDGKALIVYGTLDEYLTGEHDKMVKYVYRFPSDDVFVLEVHDLPIGEAGTKVVEVHFERVPEQR